MTKWNIVNFEGGFNEIQFEDAHKLGAVLNVDPNEFLDEYTRFCSPGYGRRIAIIRHALEMNQMQFGTIMGVTRSNVGIWESEHDNHHPSRRAYELLKEYAAQRGIDIVQQVEHPEKYVDEYERFVAENYGKKIRQIRLCHGMTTTDFAELIGCDEQTLVHWGLECGKPARRYFGSLKTLAKDTKIKLDGLNKNPERYISDYEKFVGRDCGRKIKSIRMAWDMTAVDFGKLIGCTDAAILKWEKGLSTPEIKYFRTFEKVAKEKKISIQKLNENPDLCEDRYEIFCTSAYWNILKQFRKNQKLRQQDLADMLSVSESIVSYWERKAIIPSRASYIALKTFALQKGVDIHSVRIMV